MEFASSWRVDLPSGGRKVGTNSNESEAMAYSSMKKRGRSSAVRQSRERTKRSSAPERRESGKLVAIATVTAITSATSAAAVAAASAAAGAGFAWLGLVDGEGSSAMLSAVEGVDGGVGLIVVVHFDETEALALARHAVSDDFCTDDGSVRREELLQLGAAGLIAEVSHVKPLAHPNLPQKG